MQLIDVEHSSGRRKAMIRLVMAIPLGEAGSIVVKPVAPEGLEGPPIPTLAALTDIDMQEFVNTDVRDLAIRYAAPAFASLQNQLKTRGA